MAGSELVAYSDGETQLTGLLVRPDGQPRAAVAVFPTIMNSTPPVEDKARSLADNGYLAFVCDYYGATPQDFAQSLEWGAGLRADTNRYRDRVRAGLDTLRMQAGDIPVLAIGFCMGGQAVLELARDGQNLAAVASFHGLLETGSPANRAITPRILVCHGDADALVPRDQVMTFWEEMDRVSANWHFHSYAGVEHGFTNPVTFDGAPNPAYDASADRQSWAAMFGLFDEILG